MKKFIILVFAITLLLSNCSVKENRLIILENPDKTDNEQGNMESWQFDITSQKSIIEKNKELLKNLADDFIPIIMAPDHSVIFAFKYSKDIRFDEINSKVIIGNMIQPIELYSIKLPIGTKKYLGIYSTIKDYQFDEQGKKLSFIDGEDNVYIYNLEDETIQNVLTKYRYREFNSISWSRDRKRLMFDGQMIFDIASKEFLSIAVDSYTPFIKEHYNASTYIVEMKNDKYENIVALYNFDNRTYTQIADGLYMDSDNINVLYTQDYLQGLQIVSLKTFESKEIENSPIYCANILKSTGDIIYTTTNPYFEDDDRYLLVIVDQETMTKKVQRVCTPTFYLSPAEDKIFFIGNYGDNRITFDLLNRNFEQNIIKKDEEDLTKIKSVILKMFQLDYSFTGDYDEYEKEAKKVYTNTVLPIPQEALNNKLTDFKRFNTPLPATQQEPYLPPRLILDSLLIKNNYASINISRFFINAIELARIGGDWFITGFSTHPDSDEVKEIRASVQDHINDILGANSKKALSYWSEDDNIDKNDFNDSNIKIVQGLINNKNKIKIEISEVELWVSSNPHRAESPEAATEARVKIIIKDDDNINKYKLILSRRSGEEFLIKSWDADPLSVSQLH